MNEELYQVEKFLSQYGMKLGENNCITNGLLKQLNRKNIIARSMRCVYILDNFIIKVSSDATGFSLPVGADQCINEFEIYTSKDEKLENFKDILCPVYAIYKSKFLYLTVHKCLTPIDTSIDSDETIYGYVEKEKFKNLFVTKSPQLQNEYCKVNSFGYDENKNLYVLDYGML